jgi:secretion/DNA translocation related TadE-like protein
MSGREGGSASLLVVALTGVVLLLGLAGSFLTATGAAHRRAQAAADLAALAGATAHQQGADACAAAARVAGLNGSRSTQCHLEGDDVVIRVSLPGPELLGHSWQLVGQARAGPAGRGRGRARRQGAGAGPVRPRPRADPSPPGPACRRAQRGAGAPCAGAAHVGRRSRSA